MQRNRWRSRRGGEETVIANFVGAKLERRRPFVVEPPPAAHAPLELRLQGV